MNAENNGLYDPTFEHDACGVGLIARISGQASHDIVEKGLHILARLDHRGARGADPNTGDGAGILLQVPDLFLAEAVEQAGFTIPQPGDYAVGMLFMPRSDGPRMTCTEIIDSIFEDSGISVLGWRRVPTVNRSLGTMAREKEPSVWQVFVRRPAEATRGVGFERLLFVARRRIEKALCERFSRAPESLYVVSLSSRTICYKGMLTTEQLREYYPELLDPRFESAFALVHSRFSTNTLPEWRLAQPFRYTCHNGEINTLRGNLNWMKAREAKLQSSFFPADVSELVPLLASRGSDSQALDNAVEFLELGGRSLPKAMMTLIPEAWERDESMEPQRRAFYEFTACSMEAWDGPAVVPFTDGRYVGALLDRNGLRPGRYVRTRDGLLLLASEAGVLDLDESSIIEKGRLRPGEMLLADLAEQRMISDAEIKQRISTEKPYKEWTERRLKYLDGLVDQETSDGPSDYQPALLPLRKRLFGYTLEDENRLVEPMAKTGKPPIGSMGNDTPLAVLSNRPRLLFDYFKQLFAQVTNPPLDAIREELVTSTGTNIGARQNLLEETEDHACQIRCETKILNHRQFRVIRDMAEPGLKTKVIRANFESGSGAQGLEKALANICDEAVRAVDEGCSILILSDRETSEGSVPVPSLLSTSAVHHHLIRSGRRASCSLVVETADAREVHHFCLLIGFGASAVHPYLAMEIAGDANRYASAARKGILKVMSKMGISTLQSYCGAQIFEAVGLSSNLVEQYFTGVPSRIEGIGLDVIAQEAQFRYDSAFGHDAREAGHSEVGGLYQWRATGEYHALNPTTVAKLQHAVRMRSDADYDEYAKSINESSEQNGTLRGLLKFDFSSRDPVPIDEVEHWTAIVRRFKTGAMSFGSISREAHEALAVAMNRIGGKSNTGEGGEPPERYDPNNPTRSRIKQVASGRFGVTIDYLTSADEIQIKMAQGAKPGEGGQLPGQKVYPWIAETRHSTPWVGLISPPPHHDIYSIEDLAQLIFDLKNANPRARVTVKLVSEVGVGTIAAGVTKAKADVVLISGHDGGTGAAPLGSIMHAGLPWELGLSETHQTLVRNGLRARIRIECDGQLKTGRDVAIAALLGADEFGFATAPLVSIGCVMMRKCHLNTCPVGIATQDPELRRRFAGEPEHVINLFYYVATELRQIMARLGFRTLDEMVGRVDVLKSRDKVDHWKAGHVDVRPILFRPETPEALIDHNTSRPPIDFASLADSAFIAAARPALSGEHPVHIRTSITNRDRTLGTLLSSEISRSRGRDRLGDDTIRIEARGSAGQSCGAFLAPGVTLHVVGEVNDYFAKGLSGGKLIVTPHERSPLIPNMNIIAGNVGLYGATSGEVYIRGQSGERFAVRNSGALAVVEGVGDHGCEYMTGGRVIVLGPTGRNFAAGMSGGIAYVMDGTGEFREGRCNLDMVELFNVDEQEDLNELFRLVERHVEYTGSDVARWVINNWNRARHDFVKVYPTEYRLALERLQTEGLGLESDNQVAA
jgi:glutamate synthase domain-containing protein 2/glutamate synthase domain-containing protein 1/glutamate synthase domain-containing protein 3